MYHFTSELPDSANGDQSTHLDSNIFSPSMPTNRSTCFSDGLENKVNFCRRVLFQYHFSISSLHFTVVLRIMLGLFCSMRIAGLPFWYQEQIPMLLWWMSLCLALREVLHFWHGGFILSSVQAVFLLYRGASEYCLVCLAIIVCAFHYY